MDQSNFDQSDEGIVIKPPMAALAMGPDARLNLIAPEVGDSEQVPTHVFFLTALMMRAQEDPDFIQETMDWMRDHVC